MITASKWSVLEIFGCVLGVLENGNDELTLLPLNMQNCQREAATWRSTERTEKIKPSMFLSYIGIVDDRLNPQKVQFSSSV